MLFLTLTTSSIAAMVSVVRNDRSRLLPAVHLIELVVRNFCLSFQFLLGYSLQSVWAENLLDSRRF